MGISRTSAPACRANCIGHFHPGSVVTKFVPASQQARQTVASAATAPSVMSAAVASCGSPRSATMPRDRAVNPPGGA
jgi:hypothetical protein